MSQWNGEAIVKAELRYEAGADQVPNLTAGNPTVDIYAKNSQRLLPNGFMGLVGQ